MNADSIQDARTRGLDVLAAVAGEDYIRKRQDTTSDFNRDLRQLSELCMGTVWTRPGLPRTTRSLLCIGMLTALGRQAELRIHIHGAFNNGCSQQEVKEAILQSVLYCGFPAAGEANRICEEVIAERGLPGSAKADT